MTRIAPSVSITGRDEAAVAVPARSSKHRRDIQALRAIAVLSVVVYHAWPNVLPGGYVGVDIFFVISGFLITGHLIAQPPRTLRDFATFWARRAVRLMPPVLVVLVVVLVLTLLIAPQLVWSDTAKDAIYSALYVQNWHLITESTQYLDARGTPSPMQHFWSLSVEEQYYVVWPLVVAILALGVARLAHRRFALGFGLVTIVSFGYGIYVTAVDPNAAYFSTFARLWELSLGSTLAALAPTIAGWLSTRRSFAIGVQVLGLAGIAASFVVIDDLMAFPGAIALLPTASCALVIAANDPSGTGPLRTAMHSAPAQWFGNVSYSLYLWHWPLLIIGRFAFGEPLNFVETLGLVILGFALAGLSTTYIENKSRRSKLLLARPRNGLLLAVVSAVVVSVIALAMILFVRHAQQEENRNVQTALEEQDCIGAASLDPKLDCAESDELVTTPDFAKEDVADGIDSCLNWPPFPQLVSCAIGDTGSDKKIALIGNSHVGQWTPTFDELGKENGWSVDTFVIGICTPTVEQSADLFPSGLADMTEEDLATLCSNIIAQAFEAIVAGGYDLVVMSMFSPTDGSDVYASTFKSFRASGAEVMVIRDTPSPLEEMESPPECVAENIGDLDACSGQADEWIRADWLAEAAQKANDPGIKVVGVNEYICDNGLCPVVVGGVIVYSDSNHLTATYAKTLAPYLKPYLDEMLQ